jgi:S1-C subfamily serine protease
MIDNQILIETIEKFLKGELNETELNEFNSLRQSNAEIDQLFVENSYFLEQLEKYSDTKKLSITIQETVADLKSKGFIKDTPISTQGQIIYMWNRYKKTIAVAASIAIVVSLLSSSIISIFTNNKETNLKPLVEKLIEQDVKYKKLERQITQIKNKDNRPVKTRVESKFRATGFMIDVNNNLIVTNAHVLTEATHKLIIENNNGDQFAAIAVYHNAENDIAILKIIDSDFEKLSPVPYSVKKSTADLGDEIFTLGFPKQEIVYGQGYISAQNGYQMDSSFYQLNTQVNEGNSGSPVINKNGELVGVISSKEEKVEGVVFAIKSSEIIDAINELKSIDEFKNSKITTNPCLRKSDRVSQIKKIKEYIFMIKGN